MVKNLPANAKDIRDVGSVPGLGRSPGREHGNPLQHSCLESPMDRGAWQATAYRVAKSQTQLTQLSTRAYRHIGTGSLDVGKGMQAFEGETVVFQWK